MRTRRLIVSLFASAVGLSVIGWGCNKQNKASGESAATQAAATIDASASQGVAIVNYDRVVRDMGWSTKYEANRQLAKDKLTKDLTAAKDRYEQQLAEIQKLMVKPGETMTPPQQQQVGQIAAQMRQTLVNLQQQANDKLAAYSGEWLRQYKDALAPIVRQVAQQKKFTIVLQQSDAVVFLEPAVDLTNAVVDAAKMQPPTFTEVAFPQPLQAPPGITVTTQPTTLPATLPSSRPTTLP